ncbi:unnamed protein product [Vitrella brassicaformis CCMP3155]|uniref:Uncharacterized protein n=3 Tax=Vitrella brassicaformis TaxID=1169539 RepID=A0A0G4H3V5_VITBC|nr:unnamed protein product [Vitrella brassicaformis CCMP3155]|eukprot:CEM38357.1 unnamed protein product [Vitrella brassicaformis CCMP3155]
MASPLGKLSIRVRNKALSRAHVRVVEARERKTVEQELEKAVEKGEKMERGGGVTAGFGGVEIGLEANRGTEIREKTEEKSFVRIEYGKLKESSDWTTIDPGRDATLSSFEWTYISIVIEDSAYQLLNQLIHPEEHPNGIAIIRANPPYVSLLAETIEAANIEAKEAAFRLNNVATKLVLTSKSMARGVSVGLEKKKGREAHEEADASQLWIWQMDTFCPKDAFRLVPKAFPDKTLAVSPLMGNKLVVASPTAKTDAMNTKGEAKFEQWIMETAEMQDIFQPMAGALCGSLCCQPSKEQLLVSPDIQFEQGNEERRGSSKFDDETVSLKCVGLPDCVVGVKTSGNIKSLVLMKKDRGVPMEALWCCSQPTKTVSLFEACAEGHKEAVLQIIKAKGIKCLQEADEEGFTPLHYAAQNGHEDICRDIVLKGGKDLIKKQTKVQGEPTVLHLAAKKGRMKVVTILLELGGVDLLTLKDPQGDTPFHNAALAGHVGVLKAMHAKGGRPLLDQQGWYGNCAIHWAAQKGHVDAVNLFMEWGGIQKELQRRDKDDSAPFHMAAYFGHVGVLRAMHAKRGNALLDQQGKFGFFAIHWAACSAAYNGHVGAVNLLMELGRIAELSKRDGNNNTPFHIAAMNGQVAVLMAMHAKGGRPLLDQHSNSGDFAIHWAAYYGHLDAVNLFMELGGTAELSKRDGNNDTPFHVAARGGHVGVLRAMHAKGGNALLEQQGQGGFYPIHLAAGKGHVDAVNLLVELGGRKELDKRNENNNTPFHSAAMNGHVAVLKVMHAKGGNRLLDQQGAGGFYVIHLAAQQGHVDAVNVLMELGGIAELGKRDGVNDTPFHKAAFVGHVDVLKAMHAKGGNTLLDQQGTFGYYAIHIAAQEGHVDAANLLVELSGIAELSKRDKDNATPFHVAALDGHVGVLKAMHAKGGNGLLDQQDDVREEEAWKGHVEAVKLLVSWGGVQMPSKKTNKGKTPLDMAESDEMRKLLNSYR